MRLIKNVLFAAYLMEWIVILGYLALVIYNVVLWVSAGSHANANALSTLQQILWPSLLRTYEENSFISILEGILIFLSFSWTLMLISRIKSRSKSGIMPENLPDGPRLLNDSSLNQDIEREDPLGFEERAKHITETIMRSAGNAPFAIAIEGRWGMGKTTLMKRIEHNLNQRVFTITDLPQITENSQNTENTENTENTDPSKSAENKKEPKSARKNAPPTRWIAHTIWFNPWRHRKANTQKAFMNAVFTNIPWTRISWYLGAVERGRIFSQIGDFIAFARGGNSTSVRLSNRLDVDASYRDMFQSDFNKYIEYWSKAEGDTQVVLVIFVDDLDRCTPSDIAAILEAMKLFLDSKRCIFVLGFDPFFVAESIKKEYDGLVLDGLAYLQKLTQVEYPLLQPSRARIDKLLNDFERESNLTKQFEGIAAQDKQYRDKIFQLTRRTPRLIKRLVNGMAILVPLNDPSDYYTILILLLLQMRSAALYSKILEETQSDRLSDYVKNTLQPILNEFVQSDESSTADSLIL